MLSRASIGDIFSPMIVLKSRGRRSNSRVSKNLGEVIRLYPEESHLHSYRQCKTCCCNATWFIDEDVVISLSDSFKYPGIVLANSFRRRFKLRMLVKISPCWGLASLLLCTFLVTGSCLDKDANTSSSSSKSVQDETNKPRRDGMPEGCFPDRPASLRYSSSTMAGKARLLGLWTIVGRPKVIASKLNNSQNG